MAAAGNVNFEQKEVLLLIIFLFTCELVIEKKQVVCIYPYSLTLNNIFIFARNSCFSFCCFHCLFETIKLIHKIGRLLFVSCFLIFFFYFLKKRKCVRFSFSSPES